MKLTLVQTCGSCPEQYDAYLEDELIGYMRLRHGHFPAEHRGKVVHSSAPEGQGYFINQEERRHHLHLACKAILEAHLFHGDLCLGARISSLEGS